MSKIAQRRRLGGSFSLTNQQETFKVSKSGSKMNASQNIGFSHEAKTIIRDLEARVKEEIQKRKQTQDLFLIFRERTLLREKEFHSVLEKTHKLVKKFSQPDPNSENSQKNLSILYDQIFGVFEKNNEATNKLIEDAYNHNYCAMERRIGQVLITFKEQIAKHKTLSQESYRNIKQQIQNILMLAKAIDNENVDCKQKIRDLKFKLKLVSEERQLLIDEVVQKKKDLTKMKQKLSVSQKESRLSVQQQHNRHEKTYNISTNLPTSMMSPKYIGQPSLDVSDFVINKSLNISEKRYSRLLHTKRQGPVKKTKETSQNQKIILHLKQCLERQKKKVKELGSIVTQVQNKNNEINSVIMQSFEQSKSDSNKLTDLLKSQKLFQTIKDLKKRLSMYEKPTVGSGWGEFDIAEFTENDKQ